MNHETKYQLNMLTQLVIVLVSVLGSLFFSQVLKYAPCDLCWYQRICIYPMVLIILTGLFLQSKQTPYFLAPLAVVGLGIAIYHNLVYYRIIQVIVPCSENAPCTQQHINWLGFITIPLLSLMGFLVLVLFNILAIYQIRKTRR